VRSWAPLTAILGGASALALEPVIGLWLVSLVVILEAIAIRRLVHVTPEHRPGARLAKAQKQLESILGGPRPGFENALLELTDNYAHSQRRLQRNLDLRDAIFQYAPGGVVFTGPGGWVKAVNQGMRQLVPVVQDPIGKRVPTAIVHPELAETMERAVREGEPVLCECEAGRFDVLIRAAPVGDNGACIAVVVDVSPIKRAARARSDFVANVSHELRTPITSILGYSETLLDMPGELDDELRLMLQAIDRNARRLTVIFEDLLELAQIEASEAELVLEDQHLAPLVREVCAQLEQSARATGVDLAVTIDEELRASVHAKAFERILGNLVANAIKFSPRDSSVRIVGRAEPEHAVLEVRDEGPGIAPEHHERVFERFFRVDKGRARTLGGSGLGLAMVKHLCQATRSSVGVRSNPGHGAVFWVSFPYRAPAAENSPTR